MSAPPERPRFVTIVVVTHEGPGERLGTCVDAVVAAGGHDALLVVDNSDAAVATDLTSYGADVTGVVTMPNRGYGAAANRGIAWAKAHTPFEHRSAVALLNDDVTVRAGWLPPLCAALDADDRVGAVQPKLLMGRTGQINSLGVELDDSFAGSDLGFDQTDGPEWDDSAEIAVFTAGAVLFRSEFLTDVGGFDERYFLYYEDVDLALRGAESGWRYRCEPSSVVDHEVGATTTALGAGRRRMQERNRLWAAARFASTPVIAQAVWLSIRRLRWHPRRDHALALASGLAGFPRGVVDRCRAARP